MNIIQVLLVLIPIIQAVKVKVPRENERSIMSLNHNKGPVLYPTASRQTASSSTTTTTGPPPNNTYAYEKGFIPIPMATLETTTVRQVEKKQPLKLQPVVQHQERRTGFSTVSQDIEEQIPSTQEVKLANYGIDDHQEFYDPHSYKGQYPIPTHQHLPISTHTHLFQPELPEKGPPLPYKFESVGAEDQIENNEINGNQHYQYGDFKGYQFPENPPIHHMAEDMQHMPEHMQNMQEQMLHMQDHMPKNEQKSPLQHES